MSAVWVSLLPVYLYVFILDNPLSEENIPWYGGITLLSFVVLNLTYHKSTMAEKARLNNRRKEVKSARDENSLSAPALNFSLFHNNMWFSGVTYLFGFVFLRDVSFQVNYTVSSLIALVVVYTNATSAV